MFKTYLTCEITLHVAQNVNTLYDDNNDDDEEEEEETVWINFVAET